MTLSEYVRANTMMVDTFKKPLADYDDWMPVEIVYGTVYCDPESGGASTLRHYVQQQRPIFGAAIDPLNGRYYNYMTLSQWLGDEGIALRMLALGSACEVWELVTPYTVYGARDLQYGAALAMANIGLIGEFTHTAEYTNYLAERDAAEAPQE